MTIKIEPLFNYSSLTKTLTFALLYPALVIITPALLNPAYAANLALTRPIIETANTSRTTTDTAYNTTPPNAYALLQKIDAQQLEIARLAGQIETLQLRLTQLDKVNEEQQNEDNNTNNLTPLELAELQSEIRQDIYNDLYNELYIQLLAQIKHDLSPSENNATIQNTNQNSPPYLNRLSHRNTDKLSESTVPLLTNANISGVAVSSEPEHNSSQNTSPRSNNPLTIASTMSQGDKAYADAYLALQANGADAAITKMISFIATYTNHPKIPNAHYWLGEFYLQQSPPDIGAATEEFNKVIGEYNDYPSNDFQSKALFRLAMFAKDSNQNELAKQYSDRLVSQYPLSKEADLARQLPW